MRLGRLPADPRRLLAAPSLHHYGLSPPPSKVDRHGIEFFPILGGNDQIPDCTAVAVFNCAAAASWVLAGSAPVMDEKKAPRFYAACIGQPDATDDELAATDGAMILDVLNYQSQHGCDMGQQSALVANWGVVSSGRTGIASAIAHLGGANLGITLYQNDMDTIGAGVWDVTASDPGPVVGGHALMAWDYTGLSDDSIVRLGTWGAWQTATWRWLEARTDEAHGMAWRQFAVPGIDYAALEAHIEGFVA